MNIAGYNAMTLGNHEFGCGSNNALHLEKMANFAFQSATVTVYNTAGGTIAAPYDAPQGRIPIIK